MRDQGRHAEMSNAIQLHRRGRLREAELAYRGLTFFPECRSQAHSLLGMLLLDAGRVAEAESELLIANSYNPRSSLGRSALGSLYMQAKRWQHAIDQLRIAVKCDPLDADAQRNLGTAYKNVGDLQRAVEAFRSSLKLRRGFDPKTRRAAAIDQSVNGVKLVHDLGQAQLLAERYPDLPHFRDISEAIKAELQLNSEYLKQRFRHFTINPDTAERIGWFYNRLVHEPRTLVPERTLAKAEELQAADLRLSVEDADVVVVDQFLSPDALPALRQLIEETTVWFEAKDHGGHVGAYFDEGFDHPLILNLAAEVRDNMPRTLGRCMMKQAWAYKYEGRGTGTRMHADQAMYTLNLWITDDKANVDGRGGLVVSDAVAPPSWQFTDYNTDADRIDRYLAQQEAKLETISYRANRAVVFRSRLFHRTQPFCFANAYTDRRVNISFMFGAT